jgi:hypothetical protein
MSNTKNISQFSKLDSIFIYQGSSIAGPQILCQEMDLDDEIARLEAELQNDSSSESDDSDLDDDGDGDKLKTPLSQDDMIPALPASCLPTIATKKIAIVPESSKKKRSKKSKDKTPAPAVVPKAVKQQELMNYIRGYTPSEHRPFHCRICNFQGESLEDWNAHKQTSTHQENSDKEKKACFCRLCRKDFTSPAQVSLF